VAFLWHFHQPLYANPATGAVCLPWVRLHALKDYYDMAALAAAHEGLQVTFNIVPSLLDQLEEVAAGRSADPALTLARRDADTLSEEERLAVLDLFFSIPYRTLIAPFPRYTNLYHKRGARGADGTYHEASRRFRTRDYRDLMVWFHLAWSGETLKRTDLLRNLMKKGEDFTEEEKSALLDAQSVFLKGIVPLWRRIAAGGSIELSTSPYYHPILPLLCDTDSAREAVPSLPVPRPAFQRPGDASEQVRRAVARHQEAFGSRPMGVWPSEGSLSEAAIRILGSEGIGWAASDEGILSAALALSGDSHGSGPRPPIDRLCRPWRFQEDGPALFFRERELSDLVGFTYSTWPSDRAAEDLISRLLGIRDALGDGAGDSVVSVILDGENAWEHFHDNGEAFLSSLYRRLTATEGLTSTTFAGYLGTSTEPMTIGRLRAGSWIRSDMTTWIGHPEKNRGWDLLRETRDAFDRLSGGVDEESRRTAWRCILAAEGSDWFWWFGEEHSSEEDPIFDASFRALLMEAWRHLGAPPPEALSAAIMGRGRPAWRPPTGPVSVTLDGRRSDYFEWLLAGVCESASGLGAMTPGVAPVDRVAFGWSPGHFLLRIDAPPGRAGDLMGKGTIVVDVTRPAARTIVVRAGPKASGAMADAPGVACAVDRLIEIDIPLEAVGARDGDAIGFSISVTAEGEPPMRFPREGDIVFEAAPSLEWSV